MTTKQRVMILASIQEPEGTTTSYYSDANPTGEYVRVFRLDNGSTIRYRVDESGRITRRTNGGRG